MSPNAKKESISNVLSLLHHCSIPVLDILHSTYHKFLSTQCNATACIHNYCEYLIRNTTSESMLFGIIDLSADVYIWYFVILYMLGSVHLLFSIWMVTEYFLLNWNNFVLPSFVNKIATKIKKRLNKG